jgi:putative ABC transport system ATP-binding protein
MHMLDIKQVTKKFNTGTPSEVTALDGVSLHLEQGEFLVLIGSNGSGKSTLLNLVAGNYFADAGKIFLGNEEVTRRPDFRRSRWIARVFQDPLKGTAPDLSVLDNFRLASLRTKRKKLSIGTDRSFAGQVRERVAVLQMGLENKLDTMVGKLSGGQRQALTLLMACMDDPQILLLDEPTAALDPRSSEMVMQLADELIRQHRLTAILVTHNLRYALDFGSRLVMMKEGKMLHDLQRNERGLLGLHQMQQWFV